MWGFFVVVGLVLLAGSADRVVTDGSALAARFGVSPLVVGLTVVSIGTSLPELAIGLADVRQGDGELAVGNIVGTNLVNLLLVLGLAALLVPLTLESRVLRVDLPAMVLASALLYLLARDGELTPTDGLLLLGYTAGYLALVLGAARRGATGSDPTPGPEDVTDDERRPTRALWSTVLGLVLGMAVIVAGAEVLVVGASELAVGLGASDALVGLTVVAIGTSAPELVTSVVSTFRGGRDLALGNVLGSSVLNIALILGVTVLAAGAPITVPAEIVRADLVLVLAAALLCLPVFLTGRRISRAEGGLLVAAYAAYLTWLLTTRL